MSSTNVLTRRAFYYKLGRPRLRLNTLLAIHDTISLNFGDCKSLALDKQHIDLPSTWNHTCLEPYPRRMRRVELFSASLKVVKKSKPDFQARVCPCVICLLQQFRPEIRYPFPARVPFLCEQFLLERYSQGENCRRRFHVAFDCETQLQQFLALSHIVKDGGNRGPLPTPITRRVRCHTPEHAQCSRVVLHAKDRGRVLLL